MEVLGDEIHFLFLGCYIHVQPPKLVSAQEYEQDPVSKAIEKKVRDIREKGGELRYQ